MRAKQHSEIFSSAPLEIQLEINKRKEILRKRMNSRRNYARKWTIKSKKQSLCKKPGLRNLYFDDINFESYDGKTLCDDDELQNVDIIESNEKRLVCGEFGIEKEGRNHSLKV